MKFIDKLSNAVTSTAGRQILQAQKHSPTLLFAGGVVGLAATVVVACRATLKADALIAEHKSNLKHIERLEHIDYTEDDRRKDKALLVAQTSLKIAKVYLPAVGLAALTVTSFTSSHVILSRRNTGLMAAYAALDKGFKEYRARVREQFGDEKDREFKHGLLDREVIMDEDGEIIRTVETGYAGPSVYARFFDEGSRFWRRSALHNKVFLTSQQNYLNDLLHAQGHVFLNEAYDALGLQRSKQGAVVGWVQGHGDDYIDFGVFDGNDERKRAFIRGDEYSVLLDFNVDGVIYDLI